MPQDLEHLQQNGIIPWIEAAFDRLPACSAHPFNSLWNGQLLKSRTGQSGDVVDEYSSRLVWSGLAERQNLMIVLPDFAPQRPAILLATGLIYSLLHPQNSLGFRERVAYFGSHIGIREQLGSLGLSGWGLRFSDLFPQQNIGRSGAAVKGARPAASGDFGQHAPEIITIYAPADPGAILLAERPQWIAVDLADSPSVQWLPAIARYARERQVPLICWSQNPLSEAVRSFEQSGHVFIWPFVGFEPDVRTPIIGARKSRVWERAFRTAVKPVVLSGPGIETINGHLRAAVTELARVHAPEGTVANAAALAHWRLLRSLENLCVPVDFHEAEAQRFYGLRSFSYLLPSCRSFQKHTEEQNPRLAAHLEAVESHVPKAMEEVKARSVPLWTALGNIILDEPPGDQARLVIFSSRSRKQLFLLALLARLNITEDDLADVGTYLMTLQELRNYSLHHLPPGNLSRPDRLLRAANRCTLVMTSVPSPLLTGRLLPCFLYERLELLIYAYQSKAAYRRVTEWAARCDPSEQYLTRALMALTGHPAPGSYRWATHRIVLDGSAELEITSARRSPLPVNVPSLLSGLDAADEIAKLFDDTEPSQEDIVAQPVLKEEQEQESSEEHGDIWCDHAIYLRFEHGWHTSYPPADKLNVVVQTSEGLAAEERYVRAIRVGDRVVLIYGERRQSLYDLLISRIHNHPSYALHVALVKRWQSDVAQAFRQFAKRYSNPLARLLYELQEEGSSIQSTQAIRFWLAGDVLCPDDPEDLRRLGRILESTFVVTQYRRIHEAAKRLRSRHRTLARWLNSWIVSQIPNAEYPEQDRLIDEELGITFEDFKDSFLLLRVIEKNELQQPILLSRLGRLERAVY